jgi:fluoride ion exporter CrcB/FEX
VVRQDLGTGCRHLIGRAMSVRPAPAVRAWFDDFPLGTFLINIVGAFVLGAGWNGSRRQGPIVAAARPAAGRDRVPGRVHDLQRTGD